MAQAGIYIHIPFCRARCSYCDFATCGYDARFAGAYVAAVCREIERFDPATAGEAEADTIYFGGGTPSLLLPAQLARLLDSLAGRFPGLRPAEVTLEVDPGTAPFDVLCEFRRLGVDRVSFGAQTFDDRELRRLNRRHTAADTRRTYDDLRRAGFRSISLDLIAGLPGQTVAAFERNVREALALRPDHLSLYMLELHEGTPLARLVGRGRATLPEDDDAAEMYRLLVERAAEEGYAHYEISNFCSPGREARHNTKYWMRAPVFGFGCSAHSFDGRRTRRRNEPDARRYVRRVEAGQSPVVEAMVLDAEEEHAEHLFLGLRLMRGVRLDRFRREHRRDPRDERAAEIERLSDAGLIELDGDLLRLTRRGALLSNEVFASLC